MTSMARLAGAAAIGVAAGSLYFAGLWATVRLLPSARHPAVVVLASFMGRAGLVGLLFVLLARAGDWQTTAVALAGFVMARTVIVRLVRHLRTNGEMAGGVPE